MSGRGPSFGHLTDLDPNTLRAAALIRDFVAQRQVDGLMRSLTGSTTATVNQVTEPLTIERISAAMAMLQDLPPPPILASSKNFPENHALIFTQEKQEYVLAHPDFWAKLPRQEVNPHTNGLGDLTIHNIDVPNHPKREQVMAAWLRACTPKGEKL